jgi:hypothetical protein
MKTGTMDALVDFSSRVEAKRYVDGARWSEHLSVDGGCFALLAGKVGAAGARLNMGGEITDHASVAQATAAAIRNEHTRRMEGEA